MGPDPGGYGDPGYAAGARIARPLPEPAAIRRVGPFDRFGFSPPSRANMKAWTQADRPAGWSAYEWLAASAGSEGSGRVGSVDVVRGLAIVAMVAANAAGALLAEPHPFWLRLFGTIAAPTFVTLAGMMVAYAADSGRRDARYFARRGALLVLLAGLVDAGLEGWLPLVGFDVLYVLGLSLPLAYLLAQGPARLRWAAPLAIFAATPAVQAWLGYRVAMPFVARETPPGQWPALLPEAARRFAVDGWFPAFPWLGFSLFGVALDGWRRHPDARMRPDAGTGLAIVAAGAFAWWLVPGEQATRKGYSELFYPPTPGFVLTAIGLIVLLLSAAGPRADGVPARLLRQLGRCSLFLYLAHLILLKHAWRPVVGRELDLLPFLGAYLALLLVLVASATALNLLKQAARDRGRPLPDALTFIIGR